ncbi:DUF2561 family protein [Mycolicibacterium hodleri]|uniref:DUF2561 family protein n=1 Tax=Mycolicibacterium hodleri TaxID=49897 RepID=A0A502E4F0_9MYCO|nr:DUF2561 family protein [Mycolicibacterium hodleri]TPG32585.1 DUF2561 family protein [Mycolicibacterium hodleri]
MTQDIGADVAAESSRWRPGTSEQVDRILVIAALGLWLAALGAAVAAVVALVDLASADSVTAGNPDTPWLLYTVIGVSAAVIVGAIPLLLRARQTAASVVATRPATVDDHAETGDRPSVARRLQPFGAPVLHPHSTPPAGGPVGFPTAAVEQIWLRASAITAGAIGAATTCVGVATYLMATGHDTASWVVYGVAGLITVAMPAATWHFLRKLRDVLELESSQ